MQTPTTPTPSYAFAISCTRIAEAISIVAILIAGTRYDARQIPATFDNECYFPKSCG